MDATTKSLLDKAFCVLFNLSKVRASRPQAVTSSIILFSGSNIWKWFFIVSQPAESVASSRVTFRVMVSFTR